ncbi:MAG: hydroxymethylglutaryl-CoA reductase, degradative [Chloroflexi bacterium]|nr:hydroxymethylglutaryl-CoA reductase, degradative [Chloroflexota bacterium]
MSTRLARTSRLDGFYRKSMPDRTQLITEWAVLDEVDFQSIEDGGLDLGLADKMVENAIGRYSLPLAVATNFLINGKEYLIPMVIEEPSVVAACSFAAKLARTGGGYETHADEPIMIAQVQVLNVPDLDAARARVLAAKADLIAQADAAHPNLVVRGGGTRDIEVRLLPQTAVGPMLIVHLLVDVRDAMGANIVNTAAEALAPAIEALTGGRVLLRILSNLTDRRMAGARCRIPLTELKSETLDGAAVAEGIVAAWAFADADPYRAATHNKGVMNGIDAVLLATGNDWRAIEAGAHAYAARDGRYRSMTTWGIERGANGHSGYDYLTGSIELPMAIGTVGGTTKAHPTARANLRILGVESAQELAGIIAAVGLAQNFAAIRALATEGIQKGHMRLHARKQNPKSQNPNPNGEKDQLSTSKG